MDQLGTTTGYVEVNPGMIFTVLKIERRGLLKTMACLVETRCPGKPTEEIWLWPGDKILGNFNIKLKNAEWYA